MLVAVLVLSALAAGAALSAGCTQAVAEAQGGVCADIPWGGWAGSPRCAELARRVIPGSARRCSTDADCVVIHPGSSCRNAAASAASVEALRSEPVPCVDPAAGPCRPSSAHCAGGCCEGY